MTTALCGICQAPCQDPTAYIDQHCQDQLIADLAKLADLGDALDDAVTRRTRYGDGTGARSLFAPLPWDEAASRTARSVRNTLSTWCRLVSEERGHPLPRDTVASMAEWLAKAADWLAHRPEGPNVCTDTHRAARDAERAADRPAARWYAGPCGALLPDNAGACPTELYAHPDHGWIRCPNPKCRAQYRTEDVKERLLAQARHTLVHAAWAAQAVSALAVPCTESQVYGWARHGRLFAKGVDHLERPTYAVGDVVDLAVEAARVKAERTARRERMSA